MAVSYIYIIASNPNGPIKAGKSVNPIARCKQLQTGHAEKLKVFYCQEFDAKKTNFIERILHKTLIHRRLVGEWFNLSVEKAILEVQYSVIRYGE